MHKKQFKLTTNLNLGTLAVIVVLTTHSLPLITPPLTSGKPPSLASRGDSDTWRHGFVTGVEASGKLTII